MKIVLKTTVQYEGRDTATKILDNWETTKSTLYDDLNSYYLFVGKKNLTTGIMLGLETAATSLRGRVGRDEEDNQNAAEEYTYSVYCMLRLLDFVDLDVWNVVRRELEEHFWYAVGMCGGTSAAVAKRRLEDKFKLSCFGIDEFVMLIR